MSGTCPCNLNKLVNAQNILSKVIDFQIKMFFFSKRKRLTRVRVDEGLEEHCRLSYIAFLSEKILVANQLCNYIKDNEQINGIFYSQFRCIC